MGGFGGLGDGGGGLDGAALALIDATELRAHFARAAAADAAGALGAEAPVAGAHAAEAPAAVGCAGGVAKGKLAQFIRRLDDLRVRGVGGDPLEIFFHGGVDSAIGAVEEAGDLTATSKAFYM